MSTSYDRLIDAAIESLRTHVLPGTTSDFARGQLFSVIFALNSLKLAGDWKLAPLVQQIAVQDAAFAELKKLPVGTDCPALPELPRTPAAATSAAELEILRDDGDRLIGKLLAWTSGAGAHDANAAKIEGVLRSAARDQLKIELALAPKSMLHAIATGEE